MLYVFAAFSALIICSPVIVMFMAVDHLERAERAFRD